MNKRAAMEKATGNGTREVKLSSAQVSEQARALLDKEGLEAVLAFAGRCIANGGDVKLGQARVLLGLASKIQLADPSRALGLLERVFELTPNLMEARAMACSLYDRSGQAKKGRDCALHLIDAPESTPAQVLVACDYLVRFPPDSNKALDAAKKAFDQLGKPLKWASLVLEIALKTADWPMASELTRQLEEAYARGEDAQADEKPRTNLLWCANEAYNLQVIKNWSKKQLTLPQDTLGDIDIEPLGNGRRLRVGYLSSDYREHPTSRLINGLFRHHDRSKVELFMYCSGWDDKSAMRKEVESHFEHVHSVQGLTDRAAAQLMRQHRIDVLVELNGPTRAHRMGILGYRPAPVQIDYLGWPGSVGGRVVDYVVGDAYTVPEGAEKAYPEKVIRIDATYQVNDYAAQEPLPACTRQSQGLPEGVPVLGMFNAVNKVRAEVWEVWMRIMRAVPDAILWMLDPGKHGRDNIARITKAHGVAPKRIYIGHPNKQREHLARMQCADLMLDPWPYGGHTTTADALFAGVPVVALQGTNFAGRVSGGLLKAAGLEALVQPDVDAYVKTAVMLLRNPQELQRMRAFIRERVPKSNVFDAKGKARQFEAAYRIALERAIERKSPIHINIQPASAESGKKVPPALVSQAIPTPVFEKNTAEIHPHLSRKISFSHMSTGGKESKRHGELSAGLTMPSKDVPLISCLMVSRGNMHFIRAAWQAFAEQSWPHKELIVVTENMSRELEQLARDSQGLIHLTEAPKGLTLGDLRNMSVARANGAYLCTWDDDDLYDPDRLLISYQAMAACQADAMFLSSWFIYWPKREMLAESKSRFWEGSMMCKRSVIRGYPSKPKKEDSDVMRWILNHHDTVLVHCPALYCYMVTGENTCSDDHFEMNFNTAKKIHKGNQINSIMNSTPCFKYLSQQQIHMESINQQMQPTP